MTDFPFAGLNLAVTTPFDSKGRVDFDRLETNLECYIAAGVDGFVLSSGTGMHVHLSREDSDALVARGAKVIAGRAKIIVQASALMVADVVERTRHAADRGADGVMVLPPFFEGPTDDEGVLAFYSAAAEGGLPIIGYNVPQAVGVGISPTLLGELCRIRTSAPSRTRAATSRPPQALPPQPLTLIGAKATLALREWKAGVE
jgi:4-hydroxy-tetrahydrodipicolinate synthase